MIILTYSLLSAATGSSLRHAMLYANWLEEACERCLIDTKERMAMFLAQIGHESLSLIYAREIASGDAYEGRLDLGNVRPGDGRRYRGRGLIQTTGRANYARERDTLRALYRHIAVPDFEAEPWHLETPEWAARSAANFWRRNSCNRWADLGDFDATSKIINLGNPRSKRIPNGNADRRRRWARAKMVLGVI